MGGEPTRRWSGRRSRRAKRFIVCTYTYTYHARPKYLADCREASISNIFIELTAVDLRNNKHVIKNICPEVDAVERARSPGRHECGSGAVTMDWV